MSTESLTPMEESVWRVLQEAQGLAVSAGKLAVEALGYDVSQAYSDQAKAHVQRSIAKIRRIRGKCAVVTTGRGYALGAVSSEPARN